MNMIHQHEAAWHQDITPLTALLQDDMLATRAPVVCGACVTRIASMKSPLALCTHRSHFGSSIVVHDTSRLRAPQLTSCIRLLLALCGNSV
eukprot:5304060-Amphidinium_carterae.1